MGEERRTLGAFRREAGQGRFSTEQRSRGRYPSRLNGNQIICSHKAWPKSCLQTDTDRPVPVPICRGGTKCCRGNQLFQPNFASPSKSRRLKKRQVGPGREAGKQGGGERERWDGLGKKEKTHACTSAGARAVVELLRQSCIEAETLLHCDWQGSIRKLNLRLAGNGHESS